MGSEKEEKNSKKKKKKIFYKFFYSLWKGRTHKPSKVAATKTFLFSVYVVGTICFNKCFLFHMITKRNSL